MTFKELMETKKFNNGICVGSKTSFFYIGVQDYNAVKKHLKSFKKKMEKNVEKNYGKCLSYLTNPIDDEASKDEVKVNKRIDDFYKASQALVSGRRYLAAYTDLEKRTVKDVYERETDGKTVIIISGNENGDLWFENEMK